MSPSPPPYVPPTTQASIPAPAPAAAPPASGAFGPAVHAYAPPAAYGAPSAYARPPKLGVASACTLAIGIIAFGLGLVLLFGAFAASFWLDYARSWSPVPFPPVRQFVMLVAGFGTLLCVAYGAVALSAASGLSQGRPDAWTAAVVVHFLSIAVGVFTIWDLVGAIHVVPSAIALHALFQPGVKAFFGHG